MKQSRWIRIVAILAVTLVALLLRLRAVELLPIDYDEDDYMRAGQQYATGLKAGDLGVVTRENYRTEHPPLTKLATGVALAFLPPVSEIPDRPTTASPAGSLPQPHLTVARWLQAACGVLAVLALAILNPLAGLALGIFTWQIKYTSQVMLESLPALTSLLVVLCHQRSQGKWNVWLALSAVALGLTVAGKYPYVFAGVAVAAYWLWSTYPRQSPRTAAALAGWLWPVAAWGALALITFFAADPYLWPDPINRLKESVLYHGGYAQSEHVREAGFPAWQPLVWLFGSVPWHPGVFVVSLDPFITLLAVLGLPRLWRQQRVFALWLMLELGFLLVWPTKWPQYILMLTVPLCLSAGLGLEKVWPTLVSWLKQTRLAWARAKAPNRRTWIETLHALPWLLPGLLALSLIVLFPLAYQLAMSLTDFNTISIRDGIQGGIWRAVWQGLTRQVEPVPAELFSTDTSAATREVHYAGFALLEQLFSGTAASVLVFNVAWTALSVGLQTALGVAIALLLNKRGVRFRGWWRALFILPWALPEFVGAMVWMNIFEPTNGWLSLALRTPIRWGENPLLALGVLLVAATWMGWPLIMLAATAGLKMIPADVYDAAAVDGASAWTRFRYITWPMLLPLLAPALILRIIFAFNQFYLFYVMEPPFGLYTFASVSFFFFDANNYFGGQFAVSAALNVFTVIVLIALVLWFSRWSKAAEGVTYA